MTSRATPSARHDEAPRALSAVGDDGDFLGRVGARILRARLARGWTQRQLADAMRGTQYPGQVSSWERGHRMPNRANLRALAEALDVPIETFFSDPPGAP